jgi:hypothetical protein
MPAGKHGPLAGLRVLELGTHIAGPFRAGILAEFGAGVVELEPLQLGDPLRKWRHLENGTPTKCCVKSTMTGQRRRTAYARHHRLKRRSSLPDSAARELEADECAHRRGPDRDGHRACRAVEGQADEQRRRRRDDELAEGEER